jgi:hypothetical protein
MPVSDRTRMIATLRGLLDELRSPDLTLSRAKVLRQRLTQLLEASHSPASEATSGSKAGADLPVGHFSKPQGPDTREVFHPRFTRFPGLLLETCVG